MSMAQLAKRVRGYPVVGGAVRSGNVFLFVVLAALCIPAPVACSSGNSGQPGAATAQRETPAAIAATPDFPFTLTGTDGGTLRLNKPPARIVSLSPGVTETLFAIGAGGTLVAADKFSNYPEAARALATLDYSRPSIESLAAFRPDLLITSARQKDAIPAMQAAGLPVVLLEEPTTVAGVIDRVRLLGKATGHAREAEEVAASMEARVRAVTEKLTAVEHGPRVFHELSGQLFSASPASFIGDLYTLLKAGNIADGAGGPFPQISQEVIVRADPEVIILADGREGITASQVRERPGWGAISAVRAGRVHLLSDEQADIVSRPGPRVVDALELLAKLLYPERFS